MSDNKSKKSEKSELPGLESKLYYSIREVAAYTDIKAHVLRYW
ncbi:MerR family transcriptional regulator, partial [bacterium]